MNALKKVLEIAVHVVFLIVLWSLGFISLSFFGFITAELGSAYGNIATTVFGISLIVLLIVYTYKEYRRMRKNSSL